MSENVPATIQEEGREIWILKTNVKYNHTFEMK
jgi:hypothetical protein